jgi:hypothetical protein
MFYNQFTKKDFVYTNSTLLHCTILQNDVSQHSSNSASLKNSVQNYASGKKSQSNLFEKIQVPQKIES